ncbi:MAG: hypothetical protein IJ274_00625 [Lachnospiraceae bacterium]|nr:hypothetical protein [Lachnospiraceae bacterium]
MKKKLRLLTAMLVAAVAVTFATPVMTAWAGDSFENPAEVDLVNGEPHELGGGGSKYSSPAANGVGSISNDLNFTIKTAAHMENSARHVPVQILQEAISVGVSTSDPRGTSAIMYTTPMYKNGNLYNLEVLYGAETNTIYHFMYTR